MIFFIPGFLWSDTQHARAACPAVFLIVWRSTKLLAQDWAAQASSVQELRSNCKSAKILAAAFRK
jgi:hypothetical protein